MTGAKVEKIETDASGRRAVAVESLSLKATLSV